jgi:hypothetical protein
MRNKHKSKERQKHSHSVGASVFENAASNTMGQRHNTEAELHKPKEMWSRNDKIQIAIFIVGAIYCGLTYLLWSSARESAHTTQRAWITVKGAQIQSLISVNPPSKPNVSDPPYATVTIKNSGTTPAREIIGSCNILWQPAPITRDQISGALEKCCSPSNRSVWILGPNDEYTCESIAHFGTSSKLLEDIANNKFRPFIIGAISYKDIFGHTHHTRFCFEKDMDHPTGPGMWTCGIGNEID